MSDEPTKRKFQIHVMLYAVIDEGTDDEEWELMEEEEPKGAYEFVDESEAYERYKELTNWRRK